MTRIAFTRVAFQSNVTGQLKATAPRAWFSIRREEQDKGQQRQYDKSWDNEDPVDKGKRAANFANDANISAAAKFKETVDEWINEKPEARIRTENGEEVTTPISQQATEIATRKLHKAEEKFDEILDEAVEGVKKKTHVYKEKTKKAAARTKKDIEDAEK